MSVTSLVIALARRVFCCSDFPGQSFTMTCGMAGSSLWFDHHLDGLAVIHRAVAIGHAVEADRKVEDPAGVDAALHYGGQQFLDIGADRGGAATDDDVFVEK